MSAQGRRVGGDREARSAPNGVPDRDRVASRLVTRHEVSRAKLQSYAVVNAERHKVRIGSAPSSHMHEKLKFQRLDPLLHNRLLCIITINRRLQARRPRRLPSGRRLAAARGYQHRPCGSSVPGPGHKATILTLQMIAVRVRCPLKGSKLTHRGAADFHFSRISNTVFFLRGQRHWREMRAIRCSCRNWTVISLERMLWKMKPYQDTARLRKSASRCRPLECRVVRGANDEWNGLMRSGLTL
jgi:hypothetical protein